MKGPTKILNSTGTIEAAKTSFVSVSPSDLVTKVRKIARYEGLRTLPVAEDGNIRGLVRTEDLLKIKSTHSNIKITQLMEPPILAPTPEWNLADTAEKMIDLNFSLAPVIKSQTDKTILGVIELGDILEIISEHCREFPKLREIMTREVITTHPEDSVSNVWAKMEKEEISGIPVLKNEDPVGMITQFDIIKSGRARSAVEGSRGEKNSPKVKTVMKSPVVTMSPETSMEKAVKTMEESNISRLPVVEKEKLIGIVEKIDMVEPYL